MNHLEWSSILECIERGSRPPHLDGCPDCQARWTRAQEMLEGLKVEEATAEDLHRVARRILLNAPSGRSFWLPRLRWAVAAMLVLSMGGAAALWQVRERDRDEQLAEILVEDLSWAPGGLDVLLPRGAEGHWRFWGGGWRALPEGEKGEGS